MPGKSWKDIIEESKQASKAYEPIPVDEYDYIISKAEATKTKAGDKDMINAQFKVIHGDHAKRSVFHNFVLTTDSPISMSIFLKQMNVLGLDEAYFAADPSVEKLASDLVGRVFRGKTEISEWNGQQRNEVKNFATPSAEARQLALSVPTSNNPNPTAAPTSSGGSASAAPVPSPSAPAAPPAPAADAVAAPPVPAPAAPATTGAPIPPPPPAPSW